MPSAVSRSAKLISKKYGEKGSEAFPQGAIFLLFKVFNAVVHKHHFPTI
jgi:hypothetical protein